MFRPSTPKENKKEYSAVTISIFQSSDNEVERLTKRLENSIANIIYKLEDAKPVDFIEPVISKWLYNMDHTKNDPYHLNHLKQVVSEDIVKLQKKNTQSLLLIYIGVIAYVVSSFKLYSYCTDQARTAQNELAFLVSNNSGEYLRNIARGPRHHVFGETNMWETRTDLVIYLSMLLALPLIKAILKPISITKQKIDHLQKLIPLIQESLKLQTQLSDLLREKGQSIDKVVSFSNNVKDELQNLLYKRNTKTA